jgi:hypothetical protein
VIITKNHEEEKMKENQAVEEKNEKEIVKKAKGKEKEEKIKQRKQRKENRNARVIKLMKKRKSKNKLKQKISPLDPLIFLIKLIRDQLNLLLKQNLLNNHSVQLTNLKNLLPLHLPPNLRYPSLLEVEKLNKPLLKKLFLQVQPTTTLRENHLNELADVQVTKAYTYLWILLHVKHNLNKFVNLIDADLVLKFP